MKKKIDNLIRSIPIWKNTIEISKIEGGITNKNFLIQDNQKKFVVRLGEDIPEHLVSRSNEIIASKAAAEFNIGPKVVYNSKGILVLKYIESIDHLIQVIEHEILHKILWDFSIAIKKEHKMINRLQWTEYLI